MAEETPLGLPPLQSTSTLSETRQQRLQSVIQADSAEQKPQIFDQSLSDRLGAPHNYDLTGAASHHHPPLNHSTAHTPMRGGLPMPPPLNTPLQGTAVSAPLVSGLRQAVFQPPPSDAVRQFESLLQQQAVANGTVPLAEADTLRSPAGRCAGFAYMSDMIDMSAMPTSGSAHAAAALAANSPSFLQGGQALHMQHVGPTYPSSLAHQGAGAPGVTGLPYSAAATPTPAHAAAGAAANMPASLSVLQSGEVSHMQHGGHSSQPAAAVSATAEAMNMAAAVAAAAEAILSVHTDADRERILLNTVANSRDICFALARSRADPRRIAAAIDAVNRITASKQVPLCFFPQAPVLPASGPHNPCAAGVATPVGAAPSPIPTSLQPNPPFLVGGGSPAPPHSLHSLPAVGATTATPPVAAGRADASPAVKVPSRNIKVQSGILHLAYSIMHTPSCSSTFTHMRMPL